MLFLRTGIPGAGKTLNAIKDIDQEFGRNKKNKDNPLRTIYYYNIPELDNTKLTADWQEFNTPEEWYNLPIGSIIVMDEAQTVFPNDGKKDRPLKITEFEVHRHNGFDVHLITQHPTLISPHVRKLVGKHIHIHRPFGGHRLRKFSYEMCIDEPQRSTNWSLAQISSFKLDKKYFGVYKSATQHTHTFKIPRQYYILAILGAIFITCVGLTIRSLGGIASSDNEVEKQLQTLSQPTTANSLLQSAPMMADNNPARQNPIKTTQQYINELKPRIKDVPSSAPRYDGINQPVTMPKPTCVMSDNKNMLKRAKNRRLQTGIYQNNAIVCQCYSQQGTKLDISINGCVNYVQNGYFDDTKSNLIANNMMKASQSAKPNGGARREASSSNSFNLGSL